jgi:hypothetical protein
VSREPRPLRDVIAESLADWEEPFVEIAVFGTADVEAMAQSVERFCAAHLGADPDACRFWTSSVGVAMALVLDDGRDVVLKAHQPNVAEAHLAAVIHVRQTLIDRGFPAPQPLAGPLRLGQGFATLEAYVEGGPVADGFVPAHRELFAHGLAWLIDLATRDCADAPLAIPQVAPPRDGSLWPTPHSRLFDFSRNAEGAELLDELASLASDRMRSLDESMFRQVVAHLDWRVEHVRIADRGIVTVYDWDSIHRVPEPYAVGCAAAHWAANWEPGFEGRRYPTPDESDAFVSDFAAARGLAFDDRERRAIGAARTYGMAYAARCGHTPEGTPIPGAAEEMLLRFGERFLIVRA